MTVFLALLLVLAALALTAAWVGAMLPKTHRAASRIRLSAAPEQVWRIIADFEGYPSWRPGLDRVERGPDQDGLPCWREVCGRHGRVGFRVVEQEPPWRMATRIDSGGLALSGSWLYQLEPDGDGTRLTITGQESIHNPLLRFFDRYLLSYHGVMDVYLVALARKLGDPARPEHLSLRLGAADDA
jgi:carbon monoxide dehydrogenase subunit G